MTRKNVGRQSGKKPGELVTEAQALVILGEQRVLSADRVVATWNRLIKEQRTDHAILPLNLSATPSVWYTEETLKRIAKDPAWYLIYDPGFSLRENRAILGTDHDHQPCHLRDNDWWLAQREDSWATVKEEPAYHLVRMEGLFPLDNPAKDWDWQEAQIRQIGEAFVRAPTWLVVNACISCFLLNNVRYLETTYNFGPEMDADYCFLVTNFEQSGLNLGHWLRSDWGGYWVSGLMVCLARKFDVR
jgi:hypothetical protein